MSWSGVQQSFLLSVLVWSFSFYFCILLSVAYLTLFERKVIASCQGRSGPTVVGWDGLCQPFADAVKLFSKEYLLPRRANKLMFFLGPLVMLFHSLVLWSCSASVWSCGVYYVWGGLYVLSVTSVGVYGVVMCGWASNSKYAMFGAVRALAQVLSYEVMLVMVYMFPLFLGGGLVLGVSWDMSAFVVPLACCGWFFCILAETNRAPFDFVEGESELVSGFNVEYSGAGFATIFIAEYSSIIFFCQLSAILFFYVDLGWDFYYYLVFIPVLAGFTLFFIFLVVLCRSSFPRYRYDLLMKSVWCSILPVLMGALSCFLLVV